MLIAYPIKFILHLPTQTSPVLVSNLRYADWSLGAIFLSSYLGAKKIYTSEKIIPTKIIAFGVVKLIHFLRILLNELTKKTKNVK